MNTRTFFATLAALSVAAIASTGAQATQQSGGMDSYGPGITFTQKAAPSSFLPFALIDNENAAGPGIVIANAPTSRAGDTGHAGNPEIAYDYPTDNRNGN